MKAHQWDRAKNLLKNTLWGMHRDEVFKEVGVKEGVVKKDTYARFFDSGWDAYHASKQT